MHSELNNMVHLNKTQPIERQFSQWRGYDVPLTGSNSELREMVIVQKLCWNRKEDHCIVHGSIVCNKGNNRSKCWDPQRSWIFFSNSFLWSMDDALWMGNQVITYSKCFMRRQTRKLSLNASASAVMRLYKFYWEQRRKWGDVLVWRRGWRAWMDQQTEKTAACSSFQFNSQHDDG